MSRTIINGRYDFEYLPTQQKVLDAVMSAQDVGYPVNILLAGGFGSGKTRFIGELGWELGLAFPGVEVGYFRKTRNALVDTTYKDFIDEVVPLEYISSHNLGRLAIELTNPIGYTGKKTSFRFFGIDNFQRKGSLKFDVILVDEGIELIEDDYIMLEGRLRGHVLQYPMIITMTNAGAPECYLHRAYVKNEKLKGKPDHNKAFKYFAANSFENTHNPPAYFERLRRWQGTQYYSRYVLVEWKFFRGQVWENFDAERQITPPFKIPDIWPKYLAVDFGFDHALVFLWITVDPATHRVYVYRQYYMSHVLLRNAIAVGKEVTERNNEFIEIAWADHDAENRAQFENDWLITEPARKEVKAGIQTVGEYNENGPDGLPMFMIFNDDWSNLDCKYGRFVVDLILEEDNEPTCLQQEIPLYVWGKDDKPVKERDHGCDAFRYFAHSYKMEVIDQKSIFELISTKPTYSRR